MERTTRRILSDLLCLGKLIFFRFYSAFCCLDLVFPGSRFSLGDLEGPVLKGPPHDFNGCWRFKDSVRPCHCTLPVGDLDGASRSSQSLLPQGIQIPSPKCYNLLRLRHVGPSSRCVRGVHAATAHVAWLCASCRCWPDCGQPMGNGAAAQPCEQLRAA